ncbi:hypothetical protein DPEC_G00195120 [Dallia pectoralis]|uniref:Uncharacterized protein n=1 Tax=Dallia pectoralis TaxID=75939 RepID=A0ACC2G7I9_DALPE|nr:hypothetical protein DPEC_G00195120 [Dallia pectoralis]
MNTHKPAHKAKARHLCVVLLLLTFPLVWGVPGPCRYSVTKGHLVNLKRLIENQLEIGCSISYVFAERRSLSEVCYIKAAFPQILELLNVHFKFAKRSDNERYVKALKKVMYDLYSHNCIPEINEEVEDNPVKFVRTHSSSPKEALRKALGLMELYVTLINKSNKPIDWNCEEEYAEDYSEFTTATPIPITAEPESQCACPSVSPSVSPVAPNELQMDHVIWTSLSQDTLSQSTPALPPNPPHPLVVTNSAAPEVSRGSPATEGFPSPRNRQRTVPNGRPHGGSRVGQTHRDSRPPPLAETESDSALYGPVVDGASALGPSRYSPLRTVLQGTAESIDNHFYLTPIVRMREASTVTPAGAETDSSAPRPFTLPGTNVNRYLSFLYKVLGLTPSSDRENSAYLLAERLLDARKHDILQNGVSTETSLREETSESNPGTGVYSRDRDDAIRRTATELSPRAKMTEPDKRPAAEKVQDPVMKTLTLYHEVFIDNLSKWMYGNGAPILEKTSEGSETEFQKGETDHINTEIPGPSP